MTVLQLEYADARWHPLLVRRTSRFRRRTAERALVRDACLAPWFVEGDVIFFDRTVEPEDRDLVIVSLRMAGEATFEAIALELEHTDPERAASARAQARPILAGKQLRAIDGERFLCYVGDWLDATFHEILGVVTAWYRPAWWRRPAVKSMVCSEPSPAELVELRARRARRLGATAFSLPADIPIAFLDLRHPPAAGTRANGQTPQPPVTRSPC